MSDTLVKSGCSLNAVISALDLSTNDPLYTVLKVFACITLYCLIAAEVTGNYSKVDQLWSITPWVYCWILWGLYEGVNHERLFLICTLTTIWGLRLTYNFWRRGGYGNLICHEEDYRWPILRRKFNNRLLFALFNATFIAPYQNLILLLIALPAHSVMKSTETFCNNLDWICAGVFMGFFIIETIADQQHWDFHAKKYSITASQRSLHPDPDVRDGFLQSGLFRYCRHPNYFAEQCQWLCIYAFTLTHSEINTPFDLVNVYGLGILLLITLFQGSMQFGESITSSRYPKYKVYASQTNQCIPFFSSERVTKRD